jgi:hypothetical protein
MIRSNGAGPTSAVTEDEARTISGTGERRTRLKPSTRKLQAARRPTFTLRLRAEKNVDGVRSLRLALKFLLRRFHLRCVSCVVEERGRR